MSKPGFERRLRDFLASDEFEEAIETFLKTNAKNALANTDTESGQGEMSLETFEIWKDYLVIIEKYMEEFQRDEDLTDVEFKTAVAEMAERQPMLVKLMIASWEIGSFVEICKEHVENALERDDYDDYEADEKHGESKNEGYYDAK